jgi:serine-type D-Ala-D-Ala carboxypeptidase/endopeptidase (penicillin-binding protein 4)
VSPEHRAPERRGRGRRALRRAVTALVALALTGSTATAVTLTVPALARDSRPAVPPVEITAPVPVLGPLAAAAPSATGAGVGAALQPLASARGLGTFTGVVTDPATGGVLWERTGGTPLVPGSTGKLLTTAAALLTLNPTDRLVTRVVTGPEPGTVILVGGGDPTLTALPVGKEGVYPDPSRLTALADAVRTAATTPVRKVLVDTGRYQGPTLQPSWDQADVEGGFVAPVEPLMLDGGRADPTKQDGPRLADPALAAGRALAGLLGANPDAVAEGSAAPGATALASVTSAPISELVEHTIRTSDNMLAEVLAREVAIARKGAPSFEGVATQTLAALSQTGFDTAGARMVDGSGLSTDDREAARLPARHCSVAGRGPRRHAVPAPDGHGPAGGRRRRHPGRSVRTRLAGGRWARRGARQDRHADGCEQPGRHHDGRRWTAAGLRLDEQRGDPGDSAAPPGCDRGAPEPLRVPLTVAAPDGRCPGVGARVGRGEPCRHPARRRSVGACGRPLTPLLWPPGRSPSRARSRQRSTSACPSTGTSLAARPAASSRPVLL